MRTVIIVLLLVIVNIFSVQVQAQILLKDDLGVLTQLQSKDYKRLLSLNKSTNFIVNKHDGKISHAPYYDQLILQINVLSTIHLVTTMRDRGKKMFTVAEQNYDSFCLLKLVGPRPCSEHTFNYKTMIANTLKLGTVYYIVTDSSNTIIAHLESVN